MAKKKVQLVLAPPPAEETVQRLKQWVVKHCPHAPFATIAAELGIPLARFKKAMQGKDNLPGFKWEILEALSQTEQENVVAPQTTTTATETKTRPQISVAEIARLRSVQLRVIDQIQEPVFCLIAGQDISARHCLEVQGLPECFGCAALSRLCSQCRVRPLAFPEVEFCNRCLAETLASEEQIGIPTFPKNTKVACPMVGGQAIGVATCRSMQSPACGACDAPSRICQECKTKPVRYAEYGLCLRCAVKLFGQNQEKQEQNWLEPENLVMTEDEILLKEEQESGTRPKTRVSNLVRAARKAIGLRQKDIGMLIGWSDASHVSEIEKGETLPSLSNALRLEIILGRPIGHLYAELKKQLHREMVECRKQCKTQVQIPALVQFTDESFASKYELPTERIILQALKLVARTKHCSHQFLTVHLAHLGLTEGMARRIVDLFVKKGVVEPACGIGKRRTVHVSLDNIEEVTSRLGLTKAEPRGRRRQENWTPDFVPPDIFGGDWRKANQHAQKTLTLLRREGVAPLRRRDGLPTVNLYDLFIPNRRGGDEREREKIDPQALERILTAASGFTNAELGWIVDRIYRILGENIYDYL